jgi:hypothetical protein
LSNTSAHVDRAFTDAISASEGCVSERKGRHSDYEVGRGRPPKAFRWKKGQSGNPHRKQRRPLKDAEFIERLFRRSFAVIEGGEKLRKTGFEIIFTQLMAKESAGDRRAAKTRDCYQRFAVGRQGPNGALLRYASTDFTRAFSADWRPERTGGSQGDAAPGSSQAAVDPDSEVVVTREANDP